MIIAAIVVSVAIQAQESEKEAIIKVIDEAYVQGLHNKGDLAPTKAGFHEGFELLGLRDDMLTSLPIYSWMVLAERKKAGDPEPPSQEETVTAAYPMIDVSGNAAIAKVELYRNGKQLFTDYLSLYKFNEGWRIVSKIYYKIPE